MAKAAQPSAARMLGQYAVYGELASGGMATIHFGRLLTPDGHVRTVAIKRLHPQFAKDNEFRTMFLDEARVAVHVVHPNVVPTLDVVGLETELFLVMEYVAGESLSKLIRASREKKKLIPPMIAARILAEALRGLHAAHVAADANGQPLHIVHRDISPQNVLVGTDGISRVLDFGVAKAVGRAQQTREGQLKGKIAYMAPEQLNGVVSPRTDIYAAGVTLWEALTAKRLFHADNEAAVLGKILSGAVDAPSVLGAAGADPRTVEQFKALDQITLRALARDEHARYQTAAEMAEALERLPLATHAEVAKFVEKAAQDALRRRAAILSAIEKNDKSLRASMSAELESTTQMAASVSSQPHPSGTPPAIERSRVSEASIRSRRAAPKSRPLLLVAGALAVGVVFAALGAAVAVRSNGQEPAPIAPAQAQQAQPSPTVVTPSVVPTGAASPSTAGADAPDAAALAPPPVTATAPAAPSPTFVGPRRNKPKCEPSYIDDKGHKQYRPECL